MGLNLEWIDAVATLQSGGLGAHIQEERQQTALCIELGCIEVGISKVECCIVLIILSAFGLLDPRKTLPRRFSFDFLTRSQAAPSNHRGSQFGMSPDIYTTGRTSPLNTIKHTGRVLVKYSF